MNAQKNNGEEEGLTCLKRQSHEHLKWSVPIPNYFKRAKLWND